MSIVDIQYHLVLYGAAYPAEYAFSRLGNKNEGQSLWASANGTYNTTVEVILEVQALMVIMENGYKLILGKK